jgi:ATP/maltotriose-dependent transcriptional regulator MalT
MTEALDPAATDFGRSMLASLHAALAFIGPPADRAQHIFDALLEDVPDDLPDEHHPAVSALLARAASALARALTERDQARAELARLKGNSDA